MKLVTYQTATQQPRAGILQDGRVFDLAPNMRAFLAEGAAGLRRAAELAAGGRADSVPLADARLLAPVRHPGKVLALAGNYRAHRAEGGVVAPDPPLPEVFCKPVTSVIGPDEAIRLPGPPIVAVDYEGELGVVIGRPCYRVSEGEALEYVAGYLCVNDVSGRKLDPGFARPPELEARAKFFDWLIGKWPDTFCPIGPYLVTADEVPDPMALTLLTRVNGEERQRTSTGEMIHSIARTIAWCSGLMTLESGDVIATGTPSGVGSASGRFLKAGDVVEVEVEGVGVLRNPVVD
jgi:2-keto-4-pentenoate hydratase/2-oxohepta-3-ene-1,7-dioic acid hydratase in catechol pathway